MTIEEAIEALEVLRILDAPGLSEAVHMAVSALRAQQEAEVPARKGFEYVGAEVSEQLATLLRPYRGCSRGSIGPSGVMSAVELLRNASKYVIAEPDDRFVCVPKCDYDACLRYMDGLQETEKNEPLTREELLTMDGEPVWCVDGNGNASWCLIRTERDKDCVFMDAIDSETVELDGDYYGMTVDGEHGLHRLGWIAYRRPLFEEEHDD